MPVDQDARFDVVAQTVAFHLDPAIAIAAVRAGYAGILNLEAANIGANCAALVSQFAASCDGPLGLKLPGNADALIQSLPAESLARLNTVILTPDQPEILRRTAARLRGHAPAGQRILLEVTSPEEAALAQAALCDGVVAKGNETAGRVGESTSFILLQQLRRITGLPVWAQGGVGLHTVAAAYVAGAAGVVLEQQLLLARESRLPESLKKVVGRMDGSETQCLGDALGASYRAHAGPSSAAFAALSRIARRLEAEDDHAVSANEWRDAVAQAITPLDPDNSLWLLGQDAAFAADLARAFKTVPGIIAALRRSVDSHMADAKATPSLTAGSTLAQAHRTEYPIVQGPMTRVSDRAEFALKVAEGGALPFLALALMRGPDVEALLRQTRTLLAGRPWGAGILGFVPAELQTEQLTAVQACRPDFALLAGGRPEQAFNLEQAGIPTYLHVPSPGLLRLFLEAGSRRFVFEGRECGGHVGPRASFVLWNQMIDVLLAHVDRATAPAIQVLFAGGIHDAVSSAMVMAAAAPLARLGCQIGVLVGTAYTMTQEAVEGGAVVETWQQEVASCTRTALLETGPGHAIRCVDTRFVSAFAAEKRRLLRAGESHETMRDTLEGLNVGRLRIASKGVDRSPTPGVRAFVELDTETQRRDGLYMIGQVALLRDQVTSIRDLHRDIADGGAALLGAIPAPQTPARTALLPPGPANVAIVGMGCILPKAPNLETYWENILDQVDAIREVPGDRWDWRLYFDSDKTARDKIYSKWGGFIDDVAFDPLSYGIPPASLKSIEPLQLLTLEAVRAALIDAGFADGKIEDAELRRRTSVILGVGGGTGALGQRYAVRTSLPALIDGTPDAVFDILPEWTEDSFAGVLLNVTAGRVANRFDLGGVNFTVDAACGSSLAAIRLAAQELASGTSDMVIAGGCDAFQNPFDFVAFSKTQALSPRGKCRTFDASADGIAIGEGVALVVLRRVPDAMREGARIYARIQGVGGSSDGRDKSLTAPRPEGQAIALQRAYAMAHFPPASVGLIEAHGTGTVAGDRAEVTTLKTFFAGSGTEVQACAIGSVKSMIGHTKCAAGTAGLIKVALALYHKVLPPTNNVETPNPEANFPESPFFVASQARPWIAQGTPRRAGVSAFGFGGTNFHVALEEHDDGGIDPDRRVLRQAWSSELFLLSAASREDLARQVDRLAAEAEAGPAVRRELRELAQDRAVSFRAGAAFRLGLIASSHEDLIQRIASYRAAPADGDVAGSLLRAIDPRGVYVSTQSAEPPRVGFLFPGQGAQYPNMLRDLAMHFDEAREAFAAADATLAGKLPRRLSAFIFPPPAFSEDERAAQQAAITATNVAQPAIGVASVAMARVLGSLGLRAEASAGHSYGEYAALHHAGAFDEATLYQLSEARGRAMVEAVGDEPGTMASVAADAATIERHLGADGPVKVANRNAPDQTVIAGPRAAIEQATARLTAEGLSVKPVRVACGFHSACVAPARDRFAEILKGAPIHAPAHPVYANMTGALYPLDAAGVVNLLADHLVSQVNFQDEILAMYAAGIRVFVEVGPGSILTGLVGRILKGRPHLAIATDTSARAGLPHLQHALAQLAVAGVPVAAERLFTGRATATGEARAHRAKTATAATTWLVNGGYARPAREPLKPAARPVPLAAMPLAPAPIASTAISHAPVRTMPDTPNPSARAAHQPRPEAPRGVTPTAAPAGASQVMLQYQKLMEGFLQTQQQVMLAYLKGAAVPRPAAETMAAPVQTRFAPPPAISRAPEPATVPARVPEPEPVPAAPIAALVNGHAPSTDIAPSMTEAAVADTLIAMISERTGYPAEMLGLDLDIEADLGIDSIKRVEILGAFRQQHIGESTDQVRAAMEQITRKKTLREVVDACHALLAEHHGAAVGQAVPITARANGHAPATFVAPSMTAAAVADILIAMISERTGYPAEMLGLDLDIEADLGIDSIKRVEILGAFRQQHIGESTDHVRAAMEQITRKKTLREVVDACHALLTEHGAGPAAAAEAPAHAASAPAVSFESANVPRFVIVPERADVSSQPLRPAQGDVFLITDDETGIASALAARLTAAGARPMLLRLGNETTPDGQDAYGIDLTDWHACKAFGRQIAAAGGRLAGIFHCLPLRPGAALDALDLRAWRAEIDVNVKSLFNLAAAFGETLNMHEAPFIAAATRLGGTFGLGNLDGAPVRPSLAGVPGLLKTIDQEWTNTRSKSVDFAADASVDEIAETLLIEAARPREDVEIGYPGGHRVTLRARHQPLATQGHAALDLGASPIILVTGGARGITAEVASSFAERHRPVLILCGSSALPQAAEDPATAALGSPREIKSVLIQQARQAGATAEPAAIEATYRRLLKDREIRGNLEILRRAAASVEYHQVDVRDEGAFGGLIERVYATHGRIDGVIHGAGIVEDKLVRDKTGESFDRVVDTKTASGFILARRLRPATLKFLALFTSVAGTFGNRGQSDYGAANEILSKLALHLDRAWPGRVVALSWGPWDKAGMVTPEIKRQFETLGIEAVPVELGRWAFDAEIRFGGKGEAETVWGAGPWAHATPPTRAEHRRDNQLTPQDSGVTRHVVH